MKITFKSDDDLPLRKILELQDIVVVARSVLNDGYKCYPQIVLVTCLHKLAE